MKLKEYLDVTPIHGLKTKGDRYRKFARKLGISYGTLSGWMRGPVMPFRLDRARQWDQPREETLLNIWAMRAGITTSALHTLQHRPGVMGSALCPSRQPLISISIVPLQMVQLNRSFLPMA